MGIETEQDMIDFCNEVNEWGPFDIEVIRSSSVPEIHSRIVDILEIEPPEKVAEYVSRKIAKELFMQNVKDVSLDPHKKKITLDEFPGIFPYNHAPQFENTMTGIFADVYFSNKNAFLFQMRGARDISAKFGCQSAAAGFINFGEHPYETAREELREEAGVEVSSEIKKSLGVLPFVKQGGYKPHPQPLFVYGFKLSSGGEDFPVITNMADFSQFEEMKKASINEVIVRGDKPPEAYPFLVPSRNVDSFVDEVYQRDPLQKGKNGGFFGPVRESHKLFVKYMN